MLFIDEIHRLNRAIEELLYPAMEDGCIDLVIGQGPGAHSIRLDLAPFTLVGATTRTGLLTTPLRDRFGITHRLDHYAAEDIEQIVAPLGAHPAGRDRRRPAGTRSRGGRAAPRGSRTGSCAGCATSPQVRRDGAIDDAVAAEALELFEVDEAGLERIDRAILRAVAETFDGGPVGLSTLAVAIGEETDTLEDVYEPYLLQLGLLKRTPRGRVVTAAAYRHLGLPAPDRDRRCSDRLPARWSSGSGRCTASGSC